MESSRDIDLKNKIKQTFATGFILGCLALLAAIIYPNFFQACGCAEPTQKINMHKLQSMLETYSVDWAGVYPENLTQLEKAAKNAPQPYWIPFSNPVTKTKGYGQAYGDLKSPPVFGMVVYLPYGRPITTYAIYAYQNAKIDFIQEKGQVFFLSNS